MVEGEQGSSVENKVSEFLSAYKFPLIFASVGLVFITGAATVLIRQSRESANVVFITQSTESAKLKIKVDIEGAVESPGVYEMEEGSRISDALNAAGGFSANADRAWVEKSLNRAAKLVDGGKIYIPSLDEFSSDQIQNSKGKSQNEGKININTASQQELEGLAGVGPVTAAKIISGRPYQTIEELKTKKVVGNSLFEKIKDLIVL